MSETSRTCDAEYVVRCGPGEGILGAIQRAQSAPERIPRTFAAVARSGAVDCSIEATHALRQGELLLDALSVRLQMSVLEASNGLAITREVLQSFGGTGYISFSAARGSSQNAFEVTVCFPDVVPWIAQNILIVPRLRALDDVASFSETMRLLGIAHDRSERELEVANHQLRLRPSMRAMMAAFETSLRSGFRTVLYAAALPVTRSVRIEQQLGRDGGTLDIAITRGLSRKPCSVDDIAELDGFVRSWVGFGAGATAWRVRATGTSLPKPTAAPPAQPPPSAPRWKRPELRVIEGGRSARSG